MKDLIVNEIVVKDLAPKQKKELEDILSNENPFATLMPIPSDLPKDSEDERQWKETHWGTEGLSLDCVDFDYESGFGEKEDDSTLIVKCDTVDYAPYGILDEISRRYPNATCILRTTTDMEPCDGADEVVEKNGTEISRTTYSFGDKDAFYDFLLKLYGAPDFVFSEDDEDKEDEDDSQDDNWDDDEIYDDWDD